MRWKWERVGWKLAIVHKMGLVLGQLLSNYMILDNFKDLQYEQVLVEQSESAVRQTDSCMSVNQSATNTTSYQPVRESINRRAISLIHPSHGLSSFLSVCPLSFDTLWSLHFSVSFTQSAVSLPSICAFVCLQVCRRVLWSRRWNSSFIKKKIISFCWNIQSKMTGN